MKKKGTLLTVVSSTTNSHGNLWYKLDDGNWVFSGNVDTHQHKTSKLVEFTFYETYNTSQHYRTYGHDSLCSCGEKLDTDSKKTAEEHSFFEGKCSDCGYVCKHEYYYSTLASKHINWSSGNVKSSVSQEQWGEVVAAFILTKAAVLRTYEGMRGATKDSTIKVYLKAQIDVLKDIQIQPKVTKARTAPYFIH